MSERVKLRIATIFGICFVIAMFVVVMVYTANAKKDCEARGKDWRLNGKTAYCDEDGDGWWDWGE